MTTKKERYAAETRDLLKKLFEERWKPREWAAGAENLHRAAEILFSAYQSSKSEEGEPLNPDDIRMDEPATLLYGYAMENAMKALLIKKLSLDSASCKEVKGWKSHDLIALIGQTGIPVGEEELFLKILTAHVLWAGKYPAAFFFEGNNGFLLADMPPRTLDQSMRSKMDALLKSLLTRAREGGPRLRSRPPSK